jgi:hypothetical protein
MFGTDIFMVKYDSNGNFLWVQQAGGTERDIVYKLAADTNYNYYITGYFNGTIQFGQYTLSTDSYDRSFFIAKFDSSGECLWAKTIEGNGIMSSYALSVDANENSYVTGYFTGEYQFDNYRLYNPNYYNDVFIAKFDGNGNCS